MNDFKLPYFITAGVFRALWMGGLATGVSLVFPAIAIPVGFITFTSWGFSLVASYANTLPEEVSQEETDDTVEWYEKNQPKTQDNETLNWYQKIERKVVLGTLNVITNAVSKIKTLFSKKQQPTQESVQPANEELQQQLAQPTIVIEEQIQQQTSTLQTPSPDKGMEHKKQ